MQIVRLSQFQFDDTTVFYLLEKETGKAGMWLIPTALIGQVRRFPNLASPNASIEIAQQHGQFPWSVDPLVHLQSVGDTYPPHFSMGRTLRNGPATIALKYKQQTTLAGHDEGDITILTVVADDRGLVCEHHLSWRSRLKVLSCETICRNEGRGPVSLELLTSFSFGAITPFADDLAADRLSVHRIRSSWAAEGRLDTQSVEQMQLEPSFSRYSAACERFGQVGTMPVRQFFPFVAVEDKAASVLWGAQLAWAGSWQMELYRKDDQLCLSGGLADREFGHWVKTLAPGTSFTTPTAFLACLQGNLDQLCHRLTYMHHAAADTHPASENDLPIIFNEWCTTWGTPTHEKLVKIADRLRGTRVKYLVIDAGWYASESGRGGHGDWLVNTERFPHGLRATADAIRAAGLIPGLWFEFENCQSGSAAYQRNDWHLQRDGYPITLYQRHFLNLNHPSVLAHLEERLINLLKTCNIGYLKVDYNETIGIGCDGCESLGEGLRRQVQASGEFFRHLRRQLPDLVIENCASGGHRLEPSMLALSAMSSFSDAHEAPEIPIIAANLHRTVLPRQSQIWAVLRKADSESRLVYSLAATFLGRMCLSGDVADLTDAQWAVYLRAEQLYRQVWPIIKHGISRRLGPMISSYRQPTGWQAVIRETYDAGQMLGVVHTFDGGMRDIRIELPPGKWTERGGLSTDDCDVRLLGNEVSGRMSPWSALVFHLERQTD